MIIFHDFPGHSTHRVAQWLMQSSSDPRVSGSNPVFNAFFFLLSHKTKIFVGTKKSIWPSRLFIGKSIKSGYFSWMSLPTVICVIHLLSKILKQTKIKQLPSVSIAPRAAALLPMYYNSTTTFVPTGPIEGQKIWWGHKWH